VLEGAIFVDGNFRYVGKEEAEILDNVVFVVKEGTSNLVNSVATCVNPVTIVPMDEHNLLCGTFT
jgi:hypothetical protein